MTLQQFNSLAKHKQHKRLILNGACIADRVTDSTHLLLFQIDNFYVEITFSLESDEILESRIFDDIEELEPYLEGIDLTPVI